MADEEQDQNEIIASAFYLTPFQYHEVRGRIDAMLEGKCDEIGDDFNFIKTIGLFLSCARTHEENMYCAYEAGVFNQCAVDFLEKIEQAEGN